MPSNIPSLMTPPYSARRDSGYPRSTITGPPAPDRRHRPRPRECAPTDRGPDGRRRPRQSWRPSWRTRIRARRRNSRRAEEETVARRTRAAADDQQAGSDPRERIASDHPSCGPATPGHLADRQPTEAGHVAAVERADVRRLGRMEQVARREHARRRRPQRLIDERSEGAADRGRSRPSPRARGPGSSQR